jgi:rSAM/selenodomain-associated transferase 1
MQTANGKRQTENGPFPALLIIFAKEPLPGQVKTRLSPPLSAAAAARLYHCFLEDILEEMGRLPDISLALAYTNSPSRGSFLRRGEPCVRPGRWANTGFAPTFNPRSNATHTDSQSNGGTGVSPVQAQAKACGYQKCSLNATQYQYCTPASALNFFRKLVAPNVLLFPQEGADLGARLVRAFDRGFAAGFETVLVRNSDSPDLPGEVVTAGCRALETGGADLVLGPSPDGGYYLVGLKKTQPQLFQGISWSSATVLADTLEKAKGLSLAVHLLPSWPDIDTIEDLQAFAARPPLPTGPGSRSYLCTRELMERISE